MGLLDIFGGGSDGGFDDAREANRRNRELYGAIDLPEYSEVVPELLNTESAEYQLTSDDPVVRSIQLSQLNKMAGLADTGLSDADEADFAKARNQATQISRSGTGAALNNAAARGVGGSGLEFLMREQAAQDGAERAQAAGLETASTAAKNRLLYNQAFGQQVGQMRDQDYRTSANNTNIINQFNQANTKTRNDAAQYNNGLKNSAFEYNQGLKDKNYQNQMQRADRQAGFNNRDAEIGAAESEQERNRRKGIGSLIGAGVGGYFGGFQGANAGANIGREVL